MLNESELYEGLLNEAMFGKLSGKGEFVASFSLVAFPDFGGTTGGGACKIIFLRVSVAVVA